MKRKDSKIIILFLILTLLVSSCSSKETTESKKKNKKTKKTTAEVTEVDDEEDEEEEEEDDEESESEPAETKTKVQYKDYSFKGLEYSVPDTFIEYGNDDAQITYLASSQDCVLGVSAEQINGADATKISRYDFELNKKSFTDKYAYGGQVLDAGYKELSDFWVWYESSEVKDGDMAGRYYVNFIIDKESNYAYELLMIIRTSDETKRSDYAEIWDEVTKNYKKDHSFVPPKPVEYKTLVYQDEHVKVEFIKVDSIGVHFDVENLTDANITIQADSIAVNGRSVNNILMSDDIAPHSIGEIVARCSFDYQQPVGTVGGQLRIIDFNKSFASYDAVIDNVVVDPNVVVDTKSTGTLNITVRRSRLSGVA